MIQSSGMIPTINGDDSPISLYSNTDKKVHQTGKAGISTSLQLYNNQFLILYLLRQRQVGQHLLQPLSFEAGGGPTSYRQRRQERDILPFYLERQVGVCITTFLIGPTEQAEEIARLFVVHQCMKRHFSLGAGIG